MADEVMLPQFDRGCIETPVGFYDTLFRLVKIREEHALPAIVKDYDRATGIVTVQPIVANVAEDKNRNDIIIPRPEYKVHCVRFAHGGYVIDAPLFKGDTGWLVAGDRNATSAIKNNSTILSEEQGDDGPNTGYEKPDDYSLGEFQFGFFIPDSWGNTGISGDSGLVVKGKTITINGDAVTITSGNATVSISDASVNVKVGNGSVVDATDNSVSIRNNKYSVVASDSAVTMKGPSDTITIDGKGPHFIGDVDIKKTMVTDIKYDYNLHQLQKKTMLCSIRGDFIVALGDETGWTKVDGGQAVPEELYH